MRFTLPLLALASLLAVSPAAHGSTITYTESTTASGSFDGKAFTNSLITLTATGGTSNVTQNGSLFFSGLSTTVSVAGFGSDVFTDTIDIIDNQTSPYAGVADVTAKHAILLTGSAAFTTYNLQSALGPLSGVPSYTDGEAFNTLKGTFVLDSPVNSSTFQATVSTTATTPEPSSLLLLATGSLGIAGAVRRRLTR